MELTPARIDEAVAAYPSIQPLSAVESEHVEMLPAAFASGEYGPRDAEWVVEWYYRRFLGARDEKRRAVESAYGENSFEAVRAAIEGALDADSVGEKLARLTELDGVCVAVASAFLGFLEPERYIAVDGRTWSVLRASGELDDPYPDSLTASEYDRYLRACRSVADRCERDLWELYRALWVRGEETSDRDGQGDGRG